jgi:hypothetical protein
VFFATGKSPDLQRFFPRHLWGILLKGGAAGVKTLRELRDSGLEEIR